MENHDRIAQWERMTQADPENELAWFSLGSAYKDAQRWEEADRALVQALKRNAESSRAYQLHGQVLIQLGRQEQAAQVLTQGYLVAARRGDTMPQRAMATLLEKIGQPVPQLATADAATPAAAPDSGQSIMDRRSGRAGTCMAKPPMRGPIGRFIADHYSQETWREWLGMGTKVINEFRLDFGDQAHAKIYDDHMMEWLGFTREEALAHAAQGKDTQGLGV